MYPVSARRLEVIRTGGVRPTGYVEAWRNGARLTLSDGTTRLPLDRDGQNEVVVDGTTPGPRRTLTVTLAPLPELWDLLAPVGTELHAFTEVRYLDGSTDVEPQGWFDIDVQRMGYAARGGITLSAPDRWSRVQNARFLTPRSFAGGTNRAVIASLLLEVLPAGGAVADAGTSTASVPAQTVDQDRAGFIQQLAAAASLDVGFDRNGSPFIRDAPALNLSTAAWTVDASQTGVLIDASRERNRQKTYNIVVVTDSSNDGTDPLPPMFVWDNDPNSPTYCGPGTGSGTTPPAASSAGPFGQRPYYFPSPLLANAGQQIAAGQTILNRVRGLAAQLSLTSAPNPALDDGDTIRVQLPAVRRDLPRPVELHLIDGLTVPLVPHRNPMPIVTRSTRPDETSGG